LKKNFNVKKLYSNKEITYEFHWNNLKTNKISLFIPKKIEKEFNGKNNLLMNLMWKINYWW